VIIAEKSKGDTMFFLAEGVVEVSIQIPASTKKNENTTIKKHITYLMTNDFFGEAGVLHDSPRNATVSAHTDVIIYELHRNSIKEIILASPEVAVKISEAIIIRRQETADIANKTMLSLQEKEKLTSEFAGALLTFLGISEK
jgi:CRP-like cAMP-binding protein